MSSGIAPAGLEPGRSAVPLDETDRAIIAALLDDGRISIRMLAEQIHISRANAYTRIGRMEAEGVISGYTAQLNPRRAGLGTSAYVTLTIDQNAWRSISQQLSEIPYIEHISLVGGDFDVLVLARTADNDMLRRVVLERIQEVPGVRSTRTWLVFDESPGFGPEWNPTA
ncbi:Lrp/AsnC family transcriptional regulator [Streptomyces chartreusis]|uniref:Lrp/AsnC family transcriptional regulator n=1 Tax=Streptomyces chartreusis TaxID=1969 RepID=A0A7H8T2K1_STRCX|nr:Lrp/AsnC family transcriptional regulator [Streptomyces chartreusis]QKZ17302.1 Lrp/AsnC family transcriptional regulator [Streptomyces chartreusis]